METHSRDDVSTVRAFTRFWTRRTGLLEAGLLEAGLLDTPYTLTEARVIFELAQAESTPLTTLRQRLDLDAGYLSRIMSRFRADGLVETETAADDARRQVARLTDAGRRVFATLDDHAVEATASMLDALSEHDRRRVTGAMTTIEGLLDGEAPPTFTIRPLRPGDLGWVVHLHGVLYAEEHGWDQTFEALVARIVADYGERHDEEWEHAWIAEMDGEPAGCVFCMRKDPETAQLRILLVDPRARGAGIGRALVDECVRFARQAGYRRMVLWTNDVLVAARRIYEAAGFQLVEEEGHHSFGRDLVGQSWALEL